jgi:type I restriction enzyme M protein
MPEPLFKTSGKGGTHTKVCVLFIKNEKPTAKYPIFMADVKWCGHDSRGNPTRRKGDDGKYHILDEVPLVPTRYRTVSHTRRTAGDHLGFCIRSDEITNNILVPKYYDPEIDKRLAVLKRTHHLTQIEQLVEKGIVSIETGIEVGKMAYGTGTIPFIRTSDLSNWEIKADFKHGVSEEIYNEAKSSIDVKAGDILMVRDGTYLIGTSAIVTESDVPMLFQSHIYRIRIEDPVELSPWLFFACLNTAIVKKQIRSKQFTQDIIDTLGKRVLELVIPIPKDNGTCVRIARETQEIIETRNALRNRAKALALEVEGIEEPDEEAENLLETI